MGWARFDDGYSDHPKVIAAGPWAELLDMRAVIYCARYETDGFVSAEVMPRLATGISKPKAVAARLVAVGRWLTAEGGWHVHGFLDFNPSHEQKEIERKRARERIANARSNQRRSSPDVRANTRENIAGSSDCPDPTPPGVTDVTQPPSPPTEPTALALVPKSSPPATSVGDPIFEAWKEATGHYKAILDGKRRRLIENARKHYPDAELIDAVRGWRHSPFHRGENDRHQVYDDLELLLRDARNIEKFRDLERAERPAPAESVPRAPTFGRCSTCGLLKPYDCECA